MYADSIFVSLVVNFDYRVDIVLVTQLVLQ